MMQTKSDDHSSTMRLILVPSLISLAFTLLRLTGERRHWSERWFSSDTGGIVPTGVSWIIGITWLALPFGVYFTLKLAAAGEQPPKVGKAVGLAVLGLIIVFGGLFFRLPISFPKVLLSIWLVVVMAAAIQWPAWPALFKVLLAYGLVSRIPVAAVMFVAMRGNWGTHYDYVGMPPQFQMPFWPRYLWLAFFPQLFFWVGYTILIGSFSGSIAAALFSRGGEEKSVPRASEAVKTL